MIRLFVSCCALWAVGCSGPYSSGPVSANEPPRPVAVEVQTARLENVPEVITATGELLAEESATISAKVAGRVQALRVDLGSVVREGEVLAELEKEDYALQVRQSEALVEQMRARLGIASAAHDDVVPEQTATVRQTAANLSDARLLFDNTSKLFKEGVVSKLDYDRAQVNLQAAEARYQASLEEVAGMRAQLSERRAQLALARQQLSDCTIRAPFSGAVTRRIASLGEYLAVNAPVVTLVRQHPLRLRLEVPERLAARVRLGQRIDVRLEGSGTVSGGRVVRLSPAIQAENRSLTIEGEIPNQNGLLRPGSFVEGSITVDERAKSILVPGEALTSFAGIERVFVVTGNVLDERVVKSGRRLSGERVEILSGLEAGDRVVRKANDRMAKGQRVTAQGT